VRRTSFADADLWRKATYVPKIKKKKQNKNVLYDGMGNKKGRVYLDRQNLKMVPSRRKVIVKEKKRTLTELK
jgi:ribosome production factor 2